MLGYALFFTVVGVLLTVSLADPHKPGFWKTLPWCSVCCIPAAIAWGAYLLGGR